MSEPTRVYRNEQIAVEWWADRCIHCQACIDGLPTVFNLQARPWVNIDGASADEIRKQVNECPSGALALGVTA